MDIYEFIAEYGIISLSIATALGLAFNSLMKKVVNGLVIPLLGILFDVKYLSNYVLKFYNQKILVGDILSSLLTYIILVVIIVIFGHYIFHDFIKKINQLKQQNEKKIIEQQMKTNHLLNEIKYIHKNMVLPTSI